MELVRGANHPLPDQPILVRVQASRPVDVLALKVDSSLRARSDDDLVFWNAVGDDAVRWVAGSPAQISIRSDLVPADVSAVLVVVAIPDEDAQSTFAQLPTAEVVVDLGASEPIRISLGDMGVERAVIAAEFYRRGTAWKVRSVAQGYAEGLARLLIIHGIDVDEPDTSAASEPVRSPEPARTSQSPSSSVPPSGLGSGPSAAPSGSAASVPVEPSGRTVDYADRAWMVWEDAARSLGAYRSSHQYAIGLRDDELAGKPQTTSSASILSAAQARLDQDMTHLETELQTTAAHAPAAMADWSEPQWLTWRPPANESEQGILAGHVHAAEAPNLRVPLVLRYPWTHSLWVSQGVLPNDSLALGWSLVTRYLAALPAGAVAVEVLDLGGSSGLDWLKGLPGPVVEGVLTGGVASGRQAATERLRHLLNLVDLRAIDADDIPAEYDGRLLRLVVVLDPAAAEADDDLTNILLRLVEDGPRLGVPTICIETDRVSPDAMRMVRLRQAGTSLPSGDDQWVGDPWIHSEWTFQPSLLPDVAATLTNPGAGAPALLRHMLAAQSEAG